MFSKDIVLKKESFQSELEGFESPIFWLKSSNFGHDHRLLVV